MSGLFNLAVTSGIALALLILLITHEAYDTSISNLAFLLINLFGLGLSLYDINRRRRNRKERITKLKEGNLVEKAIIN